MTSHETYIAALRWFGWKEAKHAFTAAHPYNKLKIILIFADSEEDAKAKAVEYFNSRFATVRPLKATESTQIYEI